MFLDDELLQMCKEAQINSPAAIQELNNALCDKCQDYYKARINPDMPSGSVKKVLDRTFNLWDSFVAMAHKDADTSIWILAELFEKHSFKKQFLSNEKMAEMYGRL